ncbi:hypothetical protein F0L68_16930 [Solihabitans fulvus]|uniref:Uncharacterized protein n=1 Tax=Solihabitans fulvus TaxID=1892852 RepID=A0A5B2XCT2_9PSEU|nr:hypothetical protein [Solihabitans fulvus]KAA2261467.1 hypothetical protein F0L68_16930 [Solihabitans fulvus]
MTYVRRYPPTDFTTPTSAEYFKALLDWADTRDDSERSVRRIIGVPEKNGVPEPAMLDWIRDHHAATKDIRNYEIAVLPWHTTADGLNMALMDQHTAFVAFSGGSRQKLNGFSVADPTFTAYFIRHFDQLWAQLDPLDVFLRQLGSTQS